MRDEPQEAAEVNHEPMYCWNNKACLKVDAADMYGEGNLYDTERLTKALAGMSHKMNAEHAAALAASASAPRLTGPFSPFEGVNSYNQLKQRSVGIDETDFGHARSVVAATQRMITLPMLWLLGDPDKLKAANIVKPWFMDSQLPPDGDDF